MTISAFFGSDFFREKIKNSSEILDLRGILVEVTGFEPATSCSQSRRATNCATPRYSFVFVFMVLIRLFRALCFGRPLAVPASFIAKKSLEVSDRCAWPCCAESATGGACRPSPNRAATNCATPRYGIVFVVSVRVHFFTHPVFRFFLLENSCLKNHTVSLLLYGNFRKKSSPSLKTQGFQKNPKKFEKKACIFFSDVLLYLSRQERRQLNSWCR